MACYHLNKAAAAAAAAVLFYGAIQLLFQLLPANDIKSGGLSSCAQCELLLAGEVGGGAKLSTSTLHAARQLVSLELLRHNGSVEARKWNRSLERDTQPLLFP